MDDNLGSVPKNPKRLLARLDRMVATGRMTEAEAAEIRAADGPDAFDEAIRSVRMRHAAPRLEQAVAEGSMTDAEADGYRERIANGEHPRSLRSHLHRQRKR